MVRKFAKKKEVKVGASRYRWMREVFVAGFAALSVYLLMPFASKVQCSYCRILSGMSTKQSPRILVIQPIANCRALLSS